jgi:hypothetical protein
MHFHLPKPLHGWRAFLGEVSIIVLGVLIALGAEQAVEGMHWRANAGEAANSMRKELSDDDGPQAFERVAFTSCIEAQLKTLEISLIQERDNGTPFKPAPLAVPHFFTWDSNALEQATASGALSHMSTNDAFVWSTPYDLMQGMEAAQIREQSDYGQLSLIADTPPHPSDLMRMQLLTAIGRARADDLLLSQLAQGFFRDTRTAKVVFTRQEKRKYVSRDSYLFPICARRALAQAE